MKAVLAPSILATNFARIEESFKIIEESGAQWVHIDVMDGNFVPNITFGPQFVENIRPLTDIPFDVHLMITNAEFFVPIFADAGANQISVHYEANTHLNKTISTIKKASCKAGVSLNPHTPINTLDTIIDEIDHILLMTVNPGFGGQSFIESMLIKIEKARALIEKSGKKITLGVDGGINEKNAESVRNAGADFIVAGTSFFKSKDIYKTTEILCG